MKTKTAITMIEASRTGNPLKLGTILADIEKLELPPHIYKTAADIAQTVEANTIAGKDQMMEVIVAYLLRYSLLLNQRGELAAAPPPVTR